MTRDETAIFRREGEYWTVVYQGEVLRLRHTTGVGYLARLLDRAGEVLAVGELRAEPDPEAGGAGGNAAAAADPVKIDRDRVKVTRAIRSALRRIRKSHDGLGAHLEATIRTGRSCSYRPDPLSPIRWKT